MAGRDRAILYEAVAMTVAQEANKNDMPSRTRAAVWLRRWWIGLLAVCLLPIGAYVFLIRGGEVPSRAAAPGPTPLTRTAWQRRTRRLALPRPPTSRPFTKRGCSRSIARCVSLQRAEGRLHHERRGGKRKLSGPTKRGVVLVPEDWVYAWVPLLKQGRDS
jgi:hypothetical protein